MSQETVIDIAVQALLISMKLCGPILVVTLGIGLFVSLIQSATQVQEQTLSFVPKLVGIAVVIVVAGNWMLSELLSFTRNLYGAIPGFVG